MPPITLTTDASKLTSGQIAALKMEKVRLTEECRNIFDAAKAAGRDMTDAEGKEFDDRHRRIRELTQNITEGENAQLNRWGIDPNKVAGSAAADMPRGSSRGSAVDSTVACMLRSAAGHPVDRAEFDAAMAGGYNPHGNEIDIPLSNTNVPTIGGEIRFGDAHNALSSDIPGLGGVTIPAGFINRLEASLKANSAIFSLAEVIVTADGREMPWPMIDDAENEGTQIGENVAVSESTMEFRAKKFGAYKFSSGEVLVPFTLLRDSGINLANVIGDALGQRCGRILNRRATTGTGAATLMGLLNDATVGKTAASTTAITMDELIDLQHSVDPAYKQSGGKVGWMLNNTTAGLIRKLKDSANRYLWQESAQQGQPPTLLGDPVYLNQHLADPAASAKPVLYGDFSKYKIRVVGKFRLLVLKERHAEKDQVAFFGFLEADGALLKPSDSAALCPVRAFAMAAA